MGRRIWGLLRHSPADPCVELGSFTVEQAFCQADCQKAIGAAMAHKFNELQATVEDLSDLKGFHMSHGRNSL